MRAGASGRRICGHSEGRLVKKRTFSGEVELNRGPDHIRASRGENHERRQPVMDCALGSRLFATARC